MRHLFLSIIVLLGIGGILWAQKTGVVNEAMTVDGTAGGFAAVTLAELTNPNAECSGVLETAAIRFTHDGTVPTSSVGVPVAVGQVVTIVGLGNITAFSAIRTTGVSGAIYWACSQ